MSEFLQMLLPLLSEDTLLLDWQMAWDALFSTGKHDAKAGTILLRSH
jgi:hypothetical protein